MRVLTVYFRHRPGGMMQMLYRMLNAGAARGWEMHYLSAEPFRIAHPNLHRHALPLRPGRESALFWAAFFALSRLWTPILARRYQIDLLAVFEGSYAWAVLPAKRLLGIPLVTFLQSDVATINLLHRRRTSARAVERGMERVGLRGSDRIIATNATLAQLVARRWSLEAEKISVVPNNVRLPVIDRALSRQTLHDGCRIPADAFVICTSGSFSPRKNLPLLLESFSRLDAPRAHLAVIGTAPDEQAWQLTVDSARAARNGDRVHFLGWRNDVAQILAGCDLFVFPSRHEGSPLSLIEALRVGLPCLGSDVPEIREVLGDADEALFPAGDAEVLRQRLQRVVDDRECRRRLEAHAAVRAGLFDFDWDARVTEILEDTANEARRRRVSA